MTQDPNDAASESGSEDAASTAAPGWYDDGGRMRWWDGRQWTEHYQPEGVVSATPGADSADQPASSGTDDTAVIPAAPTPSTGGALASPSSRQQKARKLVPLTALVLSTVGALLVGLVIGGVSGGANAGRANTELTAAQDEMAVLQKEIDGYEAKVQAAEDRVKDVQDAAADREAELADIESELAEREAAVKKREDAVTATETDIEKNKIPGSGTFLVGSDIKPGTYRSVDNSFCYWARLSGVSGDLNDILANDNVEGQALVQIEGSDEAFETNGCNEWTKIG
jgi:Protein of unknown function (DUF2510)